jgi:bacteriocin biosynthesis cyclodehydratase domain-containing protein
MLRLDPEHPPVWRDALTLQFGPDAVVVLTDPAPWQQRLVAALATGVPESVFEHYAATLGAAPGDAARFLRVLAPVLAAAPAPPARVRVEVAGGLASATTDAFRIGLTASAVAPVDDPAAAVDVVVLVAHDLVHPRWAAALAREDRAHLPVVFTGGDVRVGPYVVPGLTPCLACLEAYRRDARPDWPVVAAQLVGRELPAGDRGLAIEAGLMAGRLAAGGPPRSASAASATLRAGSLRPRWSVHVPHPGCSCRSPAGNATATAAGVPNPPPTRVRAYARPA